LAQHGVIVGRPGEASDSAAHFFAFCPLLALVSARAFSLVFKQFKALVKLDPAVATTFLTKVRALPLKSAILTIRVENAHYVRFPMEDGDKTVTVHISTSALKERAARDKRNIQNLALLCSAYREEIEAAASSKYDNQHCDGADVVVVAEDLS
jgi:hypothetical protein